MNANFQDAELLIGMGDFNANQTTAEQRAEPPSPASAECSTPSNHALVSPVKDDEAELRSTGSDVTPRSEAPSLTLDAVSRDVLQHVHGLDAEPNYFSPQPLRKTSSPAPRSNNPSPNDAFASNHKNDGMGASSLDTRPTYRHRDLSSTSTASVTTVRGDSADSIPKSTPPSTRRDVPRYPDQSYAALQTQQYYVAPHVPQITRAKSSYPAHHAGQHSLSHISTAGFAGEHHREPIDTGSRTVGNSPASSPGLFQSDSPPLRPSQPSDDSLYSTPWLHPAHRQAPKETHVADVDVDPVSGRKLVNHYEILDELGRGVHGKVKLGRDLERDVYVAIKIVDRFSKRRRLGKNTSHEDKIKKEIAILKKARHPHIVSLLEVIDDPSKKKVYIILEHVQMGEVEWRSEGAKEVCLVEWRRFQRESEGIFDNESAALEDEKIIRLAHQRLARQQRRQARQRRQQRLQSTGNEQWSLELGGDSEDEYSENDFSSRASTHGGDRSPSQNQRADRPGPSSYHSTNMETAFRSSTPTAGVRVEDPTGLEGTMYGAYETEALRGRAPSLAGSNSSRRTAGDEDVPEHFQYVPLMTIEGARAVFRDTVLGLEYLHYQNVIHRDIKPANLLVTAEKRIKISDFGVSYLGRRPTSHSNGDHSESDAPEADEAIELAKTVGTPAFYAPELCHTDLDADSPHIGPEIDIWALGVTLYCLIYGRVPFHDHNQWLLMKRIADEEPYISGYRLKAVANNTNSRPSSHGRMYHSMTTSTRAPHDLEYEQIDEDLRDLLQHLFIKDPRHRISIQEIKRHPWLMRDIENFNTWVEETDPDKSSHGKKIEISKDDIEKAVVPFNTVMNQIKFGFRKIVETTRSLTRRDSRKRAQSTTSGQDVPHVASANSSSSTISQDGRRPSLGPGMYIYEALSKSRESEHPLSHSVTASPEARERPRYFESPSSRTRSPAHSTEGRENPAPLGLGARPRLPDRAYSTLSSAASIRTLKQSDMLGMSLPTSPGPAPALPGTPVALDTPGGSNLGGIFGGMPKRAVHNARSNEKMLQLPREHTRAKSIDRLVGADDDAHTAPSLAISTAVASGHVDQPDLLEKISPISVRGASPSFSDFQTAYALERASSRQSSISSASSRLHRTWTAQGQESEVGTSLELPESTRGSLARGTSDERFSRAKDEFVRRRVREENLNRERPGSGSYQRPPSALSQHACPPSPDDETFFHHQKVEDFLDQQQQSPRGTSPIHYPIISSIQPRTITSSSSEDQFTSMSQSTSNPSIPSAASATSSVTPDECSPMDTFPAMAPAGSADSIFPNQFDAPTDDPAGYDGDHAVESEDEESEDEEEGLFIGKRKPARSESVSNAQLSRSNIRDGTSNSRRSVRSGSNGTVKKISPPEVGKAETQ